MKDEKKNAKRVNPKDENEKPNRLNVNKTTEKRLNIKTGIRAGMLQTSTDVCS